MKDILMKDGLAALALAIGLGAGLTASARAQTITGVDNSGATLFQVDLLGSNITLPQYTYNYVATLDGAAPGVSVSRFQFQFAEPVQFVSADAGFATADPASGDLFTFTSPTGLSAPGAAATFRFYSPDPPNGSLGVAATGPGSSGSTPIYGPLPCNCPAVPEPASLALLGLGALPLAVLARRRSVRMAR